MWIILAGLVILFVLLFGLASIFEHDEKVKKDEETERKWERTRQAVAPIPKIYDDMKRDDGCCRLFAECKAKIETHAASLKHLVFRNDVVELCLRPEEESRPSWEVQTRQEQSVKIKYADYLPNGLSSQGRAALAFWIVAEIPIITYGDGSKDLAGYYFKKYFDSDLGSDISNYTTFLYPKKS